MPLDRYKTLMEETAQKSGFSGVVGIATPTESTVHACGFADRSNRVANTAETRFGIASGTKFLTALCIGSLIDEGLLAFDRAVKGVLPVDLPYLSEEVTVRHLLTHTSGVYDYYDEEVVTDFDNFFVEIPWYFLETPRDYLPLFQEKPMKFHPGARFSYSNGGYILLGAVIEEVTGTLYREAVGERVFRPAGMERSGFFALNRLPEQTALGYMESADGGWQTNVYNLPKIGASDGGAFSTFRDLHSLWRAFFTDRIVSSDTRREFTEALHALNERVSYGMGVYIWTDIDTPAVSSIGCDAGAGFHSRHFPAYETSVTVMSNVTDGASQMSKMLYEEVKRGGVPG